MRSAGLNTEEKQVLRLRFTAFRSAQDDNIKTKYIKKSVDFETHRHPRINRLDWAEHPEHYRELS